MYPGPAQARPPARRVRIQEDAKAAAAARVTREKEKARKDTPRKKNQSRAPSSRLKDDFVVDKKVLGEGHYGVVRRCSPRADPSAPVRKSQPYARGGGGGDDAPAPPRAAAAATAAPAATAIDDPAVLGAVARRMARFVAMGKLKRLALNVLARASVRKSTFKILPLGKGTTAPSSSSQVTSGVQLRSRPCGPLQETVNC